MSSMLYNMENLAACKLTASLTTSATTVTVDDTTGFPQGTFRATLVPASEMSRKSNSEIVLCDVISSTSIGITRAQDGTTAKAFNPGDVLVNGIYTSDLEQIQSVGNTVFDADLSGTTYTITSNNDMLPAIPTDGMRITIRPDTFCATPSLALQSGGAVYSIVSGTSVNVGSTNHTAAQLEPSEVYTLVYDDNQQVWMVTNILSGSGSGGKLNSSDMDWNSLIDKIYPIGSIYMSVNNVSPATFLGGTWEQIEDVFLLAAGSTYSAGSTGGEATHTLSVNELPSHRHQTYKQWGVQVGTGKTNYLTGTIDDGFSGSNNYTNYTGSGQAHNNMPPYLTVYVWKRVSPAPPVP